MKTLFNAIVEKLTTVGGAACKPSDLTAACAAIILPFAFCDAFAQSDKPLARQSAVEIFQRVCVQTHAVEPEVIAVAKTLGFEPTKSSFAVETLGDVTALERGAGADKLAIVFSVGKSVISRELEDLVPVRSCGVAEAPPISDLKGYARQWIGLPPLVEAEGVTLYSYFERARGNVATPDNDLSAFLSGANQGELRTLAHTNRNDSQALSWVVFEKPATPLSVPGKSAITTLHESDPFAPCRWQKEGRGRKAGREFYCPDEEGEFVATYAKIEESAPQLAKDGDVAAMLALAKFYADKDKPFYDPASGFTWSMRAAEAGSSSGAFNVGLAYDEGIGTIESKAEASRWYGIAAEQQHIFSMVNQAALLFSQPADDKSSSNAQAVALVRRAAESGSADGMFNMGILYEKGVGVSLDMAEAQRWYRLAADQKDTSAMARLGLIHADGINGVAKNDQEAVLWMARSVAPMLKIANTMSGVTALVLGLNDPKRRASLASFAATNPKIALDLGIYLADPRNPQRQPNEALRLLQIAADAGIPAAFMRIGVMYAEGDGVPQDNQEAIRWLRVYCRLSESGSYRRITRFTN